MKRMIGDELIASGGEKVFTQRDAIECALSLTFQDAGISISDPRWERLCKNATSEVARQLRKVNAMNGIESELHGSFNEMQKQLQVMILQEQQRTNMLLERLLDAKNTNGANGAAKRERIHA